MAALLQPCLCFTYRFDHRSCFLLCYAYVSFNLLFALVYPALVFGVAAIVLFFTVDTWPLSLSLVDSLPSLLLKQMLYRRCRFGLPAQSVALLLSA